MLFDIVSSTKRLGVENITDEDFSDRLSSTYTVILLGVIVSCVTVGIYVGTPIECLTSTDLPGNHKEYVESYCWIYYTYHISAEQSLTRDTVRQYRTNYYFWTPFIYTFCALCFYSGSLFWQSFGQRATFDIPRLLKTLVKLKIPNFDRHKTFLEIANHYDKVYNYEKIMEPTLHSYMKRLLSKCSFFAGSGYLTWIYFVMKFIYLSNGILQFYFLNKLLGFKYYTFGIDFLTSLIRDEQYKVLKYFPRITFCDYQLRTVGDNIVNNTVQCVLPMNMFNERLFLLLWFWFIFVIVITGINIIYWLTIMSYRGRHREIKRHLRICAKLEFNKKKNVDIKHLLDIFIDDYLRGDGILFVKLIQKNAGIVVAGEMVSVLWEKFKTKQQLSSVKIQNRDKHDDDDDQQYLLQKPIQSIKIFSSNGNSHIIDDKEE
ncbi:unnamed protein product [Didymodactylos carnosus]|uniref:Innexin n=1 Tax=Didymodactylos carnosus TaxID=1234261 RepID=A0A814VBZ5_9BILA|nr:unnamed protein product [Didymodactylos carnosus]CAF1186070.1 unnamed protein product [Didymodactylos carnosus]CAF3837458.1 unnamed protein product [Didymodactylos carnosus]CAF3950316.1 unnamed protein product [Didymodactylos carnosus]